MKPYKALLLYFAIIVLSVILFNPSHITTNMLSIFKKDENIQKLSLVQSFTSTSTLFVTIKGFTPEHLKTLQEIEESLQKLSYIKGITLHLTKVSISEYMKKYYYLLSSFTPFTLNKENVYQKLQILKDKMIHSYLYNPIDLHDPLKLFNLDIVNNAIVTKNNTLTLGEYGYLLTAKLDIKQGDIKVAQSIERELSTMFEKHDNLIVFSTLFFTAQNSNIIQKNVHTILYISFALLILVFFITLRDSALLIANTVTLASSIFVALALSTILFSNLSIFTLAFGSAISSISVDYLFHNYFHFQYLKKGVNKTIFIAFFTTALGFILLQFVSFPLISQLSIFALVSLSFSYFQFTFIYPLFKLTPKERRINMKFLFNSKPFLPSNMVFIFSLLILVYAGSNLKFDYDLKNLDYDNKSLKNKQNIIQKNMPPRTTLLLESHTIDGLISLANTIQKKVPSLNALSKLALTKSQFKNKQEAIQNFNFSELKYLISTQAKALGFKENYFSKSYDFIPNIPTHYTIHLDTFKKMGYEIIQKNNKFYTLATLHKSDVSHLTLNENIHIIQTQNLLKATMAKMFSNLLLYLSIALLAILFILFYSVKNKTILALNFILFPIAMILLYLSFFKMNIMHLFSIIIIIVAGIDYGIYVAKENIYQSSMPTKEAIFYSLLTSFSGFGILVLSNIGAIHAIGVVITIGIVSIFTLVLFLKNTSQ